MDDWLYVSLARASRLSGMDEEKLLRLIVGSVIRWTKVGGVLRLLVDDLRALKGWRDVEK